MFHELTKNAILKAMEKPDALNRQKYEAQQARRILDRLVGYQVSPLLWKKVKGGLSAGRVQSVAVRIICERERAIYQFDPQEYWSITAHLEGHEPPPFEAKVVKKDGEKLTIADEASAMAVVSTVTEAPFIVTKVHKKNGAPKSPAAVYYQ